MKRLVKHSKLTEDSFAINTFIDSDINKIKNEQLEFYQMTKDAFDVYIKEYEIISDNKKSLNIMYDDEKGQFYKKYISFANKCKEILETNGPTGYGRMDYFEIKIKDICKEVVNTFPYAWKILI